MYYHRSAMAEAQKALWVLLELTRGLAEERPLGEALKLVTDAALELLPGDHASIRILDPTRTELICGARSGLGLGKRPVKHQLGLGVAGWVAENGQIARIDDASNDERFVARANQGFEIRSIVAVPMWSQGNVFGVLAVTAQEAGVFQEEHETLATLLANCTVPMIDKARLERLAVLDPLTLAFNRAYLEPALAAAIERVRGLPGGMSVMVVGVDDLGEVNERRGRAAGDRLLRELADRLRHTTRDQDQAIRFDGDVFILLMPGTGRQSVGAAAERIRAAVERDAVELQVGGPLSMTVSIGLASWDGDEGGSVLVERARAAMVLAKGAGKNRIESADPPLANTAETPSATGA
jgi:diguanylate cyclase (GGDEF)-like protein